MKFRIVIILFLAVLPFTAYSADSTSRQTFADVRLFYAGESGSFHRPQQASSSSKFGFNTDGATDLGGWYVKGHFSFAQAYENGVRFSSILNPYRGTPYIVADTTGGDWKKQLYGMWASIDSPFFAEKISFSLRAGLNVGRGAKMIDPRPQANDNSIVVSPSLNFRVNEHQHLGGGLDFRRFVENSNQILYNSSEPQKIYLLRGCGQYTQEIFSTTERERQYKGAGWGWHLSYDYVNGRLTLSAKGGYSTYSELASDMDQNHPHQRGRLFENAWNVQGRAVLNGDAARHSLTVDCQNMERSGREYIQVFNSSPDVNAWETDSELPRRSVTTDFEAGMRYELALKKRESNTFNWLLGAEAKYVKSDDSYVAMDSYVNYSNIFIALDLSKRFAIKGDNSLTTTIGGGYLSNLSNEFKVASRDENDTMIADQLEGADADYLFRNRFVLPFSVAASHRFEKGDALTLSLLCNLTFAQSKHTVLEANPTAALVGNQRSFYSVVLSYSF